MPEGLSLGTQSSEGYNDTYKRCCFAHNSKSILWFGDPAGSRTRVTAVKEQCLNLLTTGPYTRYNKEFFYTKNLLSKILLYVPLWNLVSLVRLELTVHALKVRCVTNYATGSNGAAGGNRTHMVLLPRDFPATLGYDFPSHLNRCCSLDYVFSISLLT